MPVSVQRRDTVLLFEDAILDEAKEAAESARKVGVPAATDVGWLGKSCRAKKMAAKTVKATTITVPKPMATRCKVDVPGLSFGVNSGEDTSLPLTLPGQTG